MVRQNIMVGSIWHLMAARGQQDERERERPPGTRYIYSDLHLGPTS
jgi:hypothetical protein